MQVIFHPKHDEPSIFENETRNSAFKEHSSMMNLGSTFEMDRVSMGSIRPMTTGEPDFNEHTHHEISNSLNL